MNQITKLRLPDGAEIDFVDWQDFPTWSCADLLSGFVDEEIPFFTYVVGDRVPATTNVTVRRTATERDTNVATPGSAAGTEELLIYAIKPEILAMEISGTDATTFTPSLLGQPVPQVNNLARLNLYCILQLIVSQKIMHEGPLGYYNTGFGATAFGLYTGAAVAGANRSLGSQGLPSQEAVRAYSIPIHVGGTEKFRCLLKNPSASTVQFFTEAASPANSTTRLLQVRILLDGLNKRPVA